MTATRTQSRLARMLSLVPYLQQHPGIPVAEAAEVFGVTERQLRDDLDLLFFCGLPGYTPGDLIEVSYEGDRITVTNADTIARPLTLTPEEGLALVVAARALAAEPGLVERDALDRALAKLESALASVVEPAAATRVEVSLDEAGETLATVERAVEAGRRLHLSYHNPSRDEVSERDVDPMRILNMDGRWYLEGWCRRVEDVRLFRLDRVVSAVALPDAAAVPASVEPRSLAEGLYRPAPSDPLVTLLLDREARWVADYYPYETVEELPGGGVRLDLRVHDDGWLRRLLLRLGPHASVVAPASLAAAVASAAREALAAYAELGED
ncbi:MAG TPA: WYL domain-containing protein [Frankiaceae bacterium]|nr:WYL domain-containing protein [Frankiaceae bacterium]